MFHTNVKADSFSGSNCDQRHLAVVGDESLIVVARSFPGFEKTSIYIVTDKNRKRLKPDSTSLQKKYYKLFDLKIRSLITY